MFAVRPTILATVALLLALPASPAAPGLDLPVPKAGGKHAGAMQEAPASQAAPPAKAAAATPPEMMADPMQRLRLRLAERLAGPGAGPVMGTLDLQVGKRVLTPAAPSGVGKPALGPPAAAPAPAAEAARAAGAVALHRVVAPSGLAAPPAAAHARRAATAHLPAHGQAHWGYEGAVGPAGWGGLRPDFGLCANGQRQSPIDIRGGLAVDLEPVRFDYRPSNFAVIDNGHTVQVNLPPGNAIEVGTRRYELVQFHFHRPSEERIDGRQFEMSLHLVHKDSAGKLAVVAVLLGRGHAHPVVQAVWNNLPLERHEEAAARAVLDPADLLPGDRRYFTYMGSLTTPPCSEGVQWVVMRTPVTLTEQQIELFARIYPMNARPAQPVAGRRIMQSN